MDTTDSGNDPSLLHREAVDQAARRARAASRVLGSMSDAQRSAALTHAAAALREAAPAILGANALDLASFQGGEAFRDRLTLNSARIEAMAKGMEEVAQLPDPLSRVLADWTRPTGCGSSGSRRRWA